MTSARSRLQFIASLFPSSRAVDKSLYVPLGQPLSDEESSSGDDTPRATSHSNARRTIVFLSILYAASVASFLAILSYFIFRPTFSSSMDVAPPPPHSLFNTVQPDDPSSRGLLGLETTFALQSKTLEQATSRYRIKTGREPPPGYAKWFELASQPANYSGLEKTKCLIDDYDMLWRDFEPFYQLADRDAGYFKRMLEKGNAQATKRYIGVGAYNLLDGTARQNSPDFWYGADWQQVLDKIAPHLPSATPVDVLLSGRDEPRIVFNVNEPGAIEKALQSGDNRPFGHYPKPTAQFFGSDSEGKCLLRNREEGDGFSDLVNDDNAFLLNSATSEFTLDLLPVMSVARVENCFADIRVPSMFYRDDSGLGPKYSYPNNITWENKTEQLFWRGSTTGGAITMENYKHFPRFRLIELARNSTELGNDTLVPNSEILNVKLTEVAPNCGYRCDKDKIAKEYGIDSVRATREEGYQYKYAFDIDGNSFSGRFVGLLRSGSLVFKSTIFDEPWMTWLKPYEHYIPVLPDLSDLVEKVRWAIENDAEAHSIQEAGRMVAESIMTDDQYDCWYHMALLEWGRLQNT